MHPGGKIIAGVSFFQCSNPPICWWNRFLSAELTSTPDRPRSCYATVASRDWTLFEGEGHSLRTFSRNGKPHFACFIQLLTFQNLRPDQEENLATSLSHVVSELRKCTDVNGLVYLISLDEVSLVSAFSSWNTHYPFTFDFQEMEKKSRPAKHTLSSGGGLFRLKFRRPESRPRSSHGNRGLSEGCGAQPNSSLSVQQWGNEDVAAWLDSLQLGEYRDDFISHDIRGPELLTLERRDLKELGIHKVGHIKRIQQAIWEIKENARA